MTSPIRDRVEAALRQVGLPDGSGDIVSKGMISEIIVADGKAFFSLTVPASDAERFEPVRLSAEKAAAGVEGVSAAMVVLTAERKPGGAQTAPVPPRPQAPPPRQQSAAKPGIPGIERIVAVASGKGGVGKSTTAVNLALGLRTLGLSVGLLDADIYGPSIPRLLAIRDEKPKTAGGRTILPIEAYGLRVMSMGLLVEEETPMIWRGPMVMSALTQMLREVEWGKLDVLVVDMPPGTGDAQLTMAQQVPLAGAVIVSTPQDLSLIDARRGLAMFRKVDVPVLGIVENMSYFVAPDTGRRYDIFGHGGAKAEAARLGVRFLGEVPLEMAIRETSDAGRPVVATDPDGPHAASYRSIAAEVLDELGRVAVGGAAAPRIVFE
ncbi:Mrp/NBP35 family ATP-binding protein [Aureimonas leprariae]|uniref:Iron-sulfur cluster carrier protein n=1 Tax=Plantimonas leprariae TaxID=2615207 RepID=A0A7V7PPI9_9HYPH|nr:Mrp/NBP35 family ATP-binding protein [Aureimonas leprariae]KAB0679862.1 Mrp/NBP35 family ATP-binding protein [Aureimonas leprariae]